jgi:hypothetical protein
VFTPRLTLTKHRSIWQLLPVFFRPIALQSFRPIASEGQIEDRRFTAVMKDPWVHEKLFRRDRKVMPPFRLANACRLIMGMEVTADLPAEVFDDQIRERSRWRGGRCACATPGCFG